jgi:hypothetical protein
MRPAAAAVVTALSASIWVTGFAPTSAQAQDGDQALTRALLTLQAVGTLGATVKDWCDERSAQTREAHAAGMSAWRKTVALDKIDARLAARKQGVSVDTQEQRERINARLDKQYKRPDVPCGNLEKFLLAEFDPRRLYPAEYKLAFTQPPEAWLTRITDDPRASSAAKSAAPTRAKEATSSVAPIDPKRALQEKDIEVVLFSVEQSYRGTNYVATEYTYLLLKDASVRSAVPGPAPSDFDLVADRARNPTLWGKWKKSGGSYQVKFANRAFETPSPQVERLPGKKGQRLDKHFEASSGESHGTVGFWQLRGLRLDKDGTFRRSSSGGGGGTAGHGDTAASVYSTHTDKRGQTVVASPSGGTSTSRRTGITDADLMGTYEIDGYTLTLVYGNGRVVRGFFYISHHGKSIWFEGRQLSVTD